MTACVRTEQEQQTRFKYWKNDLERRGITPGDAVGANDIKKPAFWATRDAIDYAADALAKTQIPIPKKPLPEPARPAKAKDTGPVVIGLGDYTLKMLQDFDKERGVPLPNYGTARGKTGPRAVPAEPLGRTRSEPRLLPARTASNLSALSGVTGSTYTWGYASNVSGLSRAEILRAAESVLGSDVSLGASTDRWSGPAETDRWDRTAAIPETAKH